MVTASHSSAGAPARAYALDALRGLAILAMLLSGQLPFDQNALPAWMYHAQEPPPKFEWDGTLPGISWVDLVFPFFLFVMGAAFPLALARRMEINLPTWKLTVSVLHRGFLLAFFALFVMAIRPYVINGHPTEATWFLALLGFFILFPILTRLPEKWRTSVKISIRAAGWLAALSFFFLIKYPDGSGFRLWRSDIIIVVLTNMAVFGALAWMFTRHNLLARLGLLGLLLAIRLSNLPQPAHGWVNDLWTASQHWWLSWICQLYYLQYLNIVIPGTIAGDLILEWTRQVRPAAEVSVAKSWTLLHYACVGALMFGFVVVLLAGLKARWLPAATFIGFGLCFLGWKLTQHPLNEIEKLYNKLFQWAIYWLVLGLLLEPYEGGIKKDHPTLSYYFITSGLAICAYIGFSILIDVLQLKRWARLLIDNGQNPMIAYAGINNFVAPVLALLPAGAGLSVSDRLDDFVTSPWRGFLRGVIVTLLMAGAVSFLTRKKVFWRT